MFGSPARSKPSAFSVVEADVGRTLLRVRRLERREPPDVGHVVRARLLVAVRRRARARTRSRACAGTPASDAAAASLSAAASVRSEMAFSSSLRAIGSGSPDRSADSSSPARASSSRSSLKVAFRSAKQLAELLAVGVLVQHGELRLCRAQRQLLVAERQPRGELAVLQLVLALDQLGGDDPALADLAQPVELLPLVSRPPRSSASHSASSWSRVNRSA